MRRSSRLVCAVGLAISIFAPLALAAPPVLDRVPGNAIAVIITPSLGKLHKNAKAFIEAIGSPVPVPELDEILIPMGIEDNKGINPATASIAMTFIAPPPGGDADAPPDSEQMVVIIVQASNYADFVGNFGAKPGAAGGIDTGSIQGSDAFFKDLGGGYLAMAPVKETIERAQWNDANGAAHAAALGKNGEALVESSDLSLIVFTQQAKQFMPQIEQAIDDQLADNPVAGPLGQLKDSPFAAFLTGALMNDSTSTVTGLRVDGQGINFNNSLTFKEGSDSAKMFSGLTGSSDQLLARLPAQPYFFAMAADLSSPGARQLIDNMVANLGEDGKVGISGFMANWLKNSDGAAAVIGMPAGGLMAGLFTSTIAYVKTSNPDAFIKNMQDGLAQLNGKSVGGLLLETSFGSKDADVEGTKVDTWGIKISMDENSDEDPGQVAMALPFVFGQAGPSGYLERANGGLYQTFGRNQGLISDVRKLGNGTHSFTADKTLAKVAEQLPKKRLGELYVGVKDLLEAAVPLMAMDNVNVEIDIPPSLPPFGMGFAGGDIGLHFGMYLPAQSLKVVMKVVQQLRAAQMGGDEVDPEAGKKNDAPKGAGQPRF